jgi:hypothetical protein
VSKASSGTIVCARFLEIIPADRPVNIGARQFFTPRRVAPDLAETAAKFSTPVQHHQQFVIDLNAFIDNIFINKCFFLNILFLIEIKISTCTPAIIISTTKNRRLLKIAPCHRCKSAACAFGGWAKRVAELACTSSECAELAIHDA